MRFSDLSSDVCTSDLLAMHEQMRDFLELALRGDIENVVAAVVQVIAAAADRAQRGVAASRAGQRDGFFRLERRGGGFSHRAVLLLWATRLTSSSTRTMRRACFQMRASRCGHTARRGSDRKSVV